MNPRFLERSVNGSFSGREERNEILQMLAGAGVAILDETDSRPRTSMAADRGGGVSTSSPPRQSATLGCHALPAVAMMLITPDLRPVNGGPWEWILRTRQGVAAGTRRNRG